MAKELIGEDKVALWETAPWSTMNRYDMYTYDQLHFWTLGVLKRLIKGKPLPSSRILHD